MKNNQYELNPHTIEKFLQKPCKDFTKQDIIEFIIGNEIEMLNFRYVAEDGKLKTLNFVINSLEHLDQILSTGERVDGSSLFSFIGAGSSDLYVIPRYSSAFVNPFETIPTVDIMCSYYDFEGKPLESSPEYILKKAHKEFKKNTGFTFKALGELEYYIIADKSYNEIYPAIDQKGYHESSPFTKFEFIRLEAMKYIAACGGKIKYGHSEVGNFMDDKFYYEQQEIEFLPCEAESAVEQLLIAKWVLEKLCCEYSVEVNFSPKLTVGKAGSGLHIHMMLEKDGKNMMVENNKLSNIARKMIAGILDLADALPAFGNRTQDSYLRLVPHQEAPTNICWGDRNRSVLVRVPLGWTFGAGMTNDANPQEKVIMELKDSKQTVEIRSGDCTADLYLYMASLIVAAQHGLEMENALELAEKLYVNIDIFKDEKKLAELNALPVSCKNSAEILNKKRAFFEKNGIFSKGLIDNTIEILSKK
ncbi:MAG: glutamine synthetase family protein [Bacteroidales bacterium]|jgi:glutamine synthetase|nr:glutamine synthetase family protein [Bacteroidales bacterium]